MASCMQKLDTSFGIYILDIYLMRGTSREKKKSKLTQVSPNHLSQVSNGLAI